MVTVKLMCPQWAESRAVLGDYSPVKPCQIFQGAGHVSWWQVETPARQGEWFSCLTTCILGFGSNINQFYWRLGPGLGFTAPQPSPVYCLCSISAGSTGGVSQWILEYAPPRLLGSLIWFKTIKRLNFSANLCLELQEKSTFLGQKKEN